MSIATSPRLASLAHNALKPAHPNHAVEPRLVALWSAPGSVGRTSTALNLDAYAATKMRVLLLDLDFVAPSVALLAGSQDLPSLSTVLYHHQIGPSVDEEFLQEFAPYFADSPKSFRVIAGLSRPERWPEIELQVLQNLLKDLAPFADLVVCDIHASSHKALAVNAVARGILKQADSVIALANANALALARLLREIQDLQTLLPRSTAIHVAFNQLVAKPIQPPELNAFVELTKMPAPATIREDQDVFGMLVARASTKATLRKRSAYKTDIQALTHKVLGL